jgi:A/G-specific adenine glycosylase
MDGNVERVISRLYAITMRRFPAPKPADEGAKVRNLTPPDRPGDFAQAMMDLGATICTPKRPACALCPLQCDHCLAILREHDPERVSGESRRRRSKTGAARVPPSWPSMTRRVRSCCERSGRERPARRHDGGADDSAGPPARTDGETGTEVTRPFRSQTGRPAGVTHVFTHFELRLSVYRAKVPGETIHAGAGWMVGAGYRTISTAQALPTVMKK